jgi:DNA-binding MarR family transcriptional regulator
MKDHIIGLVAEAKVLNSKVFSLPRLLILTALEELGQDGPTYRELKAGLELEDGTLFSNLNALEEMGYVKKEKVELDNKEMHSYWITQDGKEALRALRLWFKSWVGGD